MESDLGGTGTYTVNLSQTASPTILTALPTASNQITATTSAAGAAQRTLPTAPAGTWPRTSMRAGSPMAIATTPPSGWWA